MAAILATIGFTGAVVFTPVGQNLVAGAMIRIDDLYQIGEAVTVGDLHGTVVYRSMLRTELELPDGSKACVRLVVPGAPSTQPQPDGRLANVRRDAARPGVGPRDGHDVMDEVITSLKWNSRGKRAFVALDHVGGAGHVLHRLRLDRRPNP